MLIILHSIDFTFLKKLLFEFSKRHGEIDLNTDLKSNIQCIEKDPKNVQDIFNTKM
jgi:hypothetical protein